MSAPVVIAAALPEEVAPLRERVLRRRFHRLGGGRVESGELDGNPVVLVLTGEGALAAERALPKVILEVRPRQLIAMGFAGGLSPGLSRGAVLMAREVRRAGSRSFIARAAMGQPDVTAGVVVSAPGWVSTPAEKAELRRRFAPLEAAVTDLESWTCARLAEDAGVPWAVVRSVSDAHDDLLPRFLLECRDGEGILRRSAVLAYALRHPGVVPQLLELRERVRSCAEGLARCVAGLVGSRSA
ncbi:MAG: phosphorylase family protein [Myxococcaceae bacterium]